MRKFTRQDKKKITLEWLAQFPSLGIYKPMWLMNRIGPLVMGVLLHVKSGNENYTPTFHVHCLLSEFSAITLSLHSAPLGYVTLPHHEMYFQRVIEEFREHVFMPLEGDLNLDFIMQGYRYYLNHCKYPRKQMAYEDMILLASWCGVEDLRIQLLKEAKEEISIWPSDSMEKMGGVDAWVSKIDRESADRNKLQQIFEQELVRHKLENIPVRNIIMP